MNKFSGRIVCSASDLMGFLLCPHVTTLNLVDLDTPLKRCVPGEDVRLLQEKGFAHEADYLETIRGENTIVELTTSGDLNENHTATLAALTSGVDLVFQAAFADGTYAGYADFLRRVELPSSLGTWSYEVADTKLALRPKPKFMIQLAHYSELLTSVQNVQPKRMHLILGNRAEGSFLVGDYIYYYKRLRQRFQLFIKERPATAPEKCDHCDFCEWREHCASEWEEKDHLNQVADISKTQIKRLRAYGIHTLAQLGELTAKAVVPTIHPDTLSRLRAQAGLQLKKRITGANEMELLPCDPLSSKGFSRLPCPDEGDLFFDMEGDPMYEGGLEYLFGVHYLDNGKWSFTAFWAHDRNEEKEAFDKLVEFVTAHLIRHPNAHIYHYGHYEPTALKRLMSLHGIRETEIDQLLREGKFIDLYRVVREAIRISEPRYSLKNMETFYMDKREGEVTNAGASIVYYERWRETRDSELLRKIRDYNHDDCISTQLLREWLLGLKPQDTAFMERLSTEGPVVEKSDKIKAHEARLAAYGSRLLTGVPTESDQWTDEHRLRVLMLQLLDFHRRAAKPAWWALFARRDMTDEELIEDTECIAMLQLISTKTPERSNRANTVTYRYPEQEFKLREGDNCVRTDTSQNLGSIGVIDEDERTVEIRIGKNKEIPHNISVSLGGPISTETIKNALFRLADALLSGEGKFLAALDFLRKAEPLIRGHKAATPIVSQATDALPQIVEAVVNLDHSTLFIQGPPGAGKTYTGSHLIAELIAQGYRVGVTSNSHKVIHNLLHAVEKRADERGLKFGGIYKASQTKDSAFAGTYLESAATNADVFDTLSNPYYQLYAGTAWLFSDAGLEQKLDYLFVDEAGQVATANLVAMATSTRNIVLLGDQMQLGQPIQGVHPGESGLSSLDFLLEGRATIPPDKGVFLDTTWRMHPDVCHFISETVYEGRLHPELRNAEQRIILGRNAHPALRPTGLSFVPALHDACSQRSDKEAGIISSIYASLLEQRYRDQSGDEHPITVNNILVVAPYNIQVNLLKQILPFGARVGTVDKFQGQEAEVVIISMTTSNGDSLPRHIEFLYSKNRLNVAISRARSLALIVASPALADIPCATVEQMGLVNLLCRAMGFSEDGDALSQIS